MNRFLLLVVLMFCVVFTMSAEAHSDIFRKHHSGAFLEVDGAINDNAIASDSLKLIGRAYGESITLRWYPESFDDWLEHTRTGYTLKKYRAINDFEVVYTNSDLMFEKTIEPWSVEMVEREFQMTQDSIVLIIGDLLDENISKEERESTYNLVQILGMRFPKLYEMMGMQISDDDVEKRQSYYYEVSLTGSETKLEGANLALLNDHFPMKSPKEMEVVKKDHSVDLMIDKRHHDSTYVMINVSISDSPEGPFISETEGPFMLNEDSTALDVYNYNIPVSENYKVYYFKYEGMNIFGDISPPLYFDSYGIDLEAPPPPTIHFPKLIGEYKVNVSWDEIEAPDDFAGYKVELGNLPEDRFTTVSDLLVPGMTSYVHELDSTSSESVYFKVAAYDTHGNKATSIPMMLNVRDTIPPLAPSNLNGTIDDNGFVEITWDEAIEDLGGYRVFFANDSTAEFSQLTTEVLSTDNIFHDTIAMNMLADEIYYVVEAEDRSYNRSDYSKILTLKRPDILPPVAPVILPTSSDGDGIKVNWRASTSYDVVMHYLYRKLESESDEEWVVLDSLPFFGENYIDSTAQIEVVYNYRVQAMDDVRLVSDFTLAVAGRRYFDGDIEVISDLAVAYDEGTTTTQVSWLPKASGDEFLSEKDYRYVIYKGNTAEDLTRLIQLVDKTPQYTDDDIEVGSDYYYAIQLLYDDGKKSNLSTPVFISIK